MLKRMAVRSLLTALAIAAGASSASAQVFGTFTWQMQPYCNQVTLTLTSVTGNFTLDGSDNMCGGAKKSSAVGIGVFNPDGSVGINFEIVLPTGQSVHVAASVSPANGQGTWSDDLGNSGTFAFFGNSPGLPPLPVGDVRFRISGLTGTLPVASSAIVDVNTWSTTIYNVGGGVYTPATGRYAVPQSGVYLITANLRWAAFANTNNRWCVRIDASNGIAITCGTPSTDPFTIPAVSAVSFLSAGTEVKIRAFQNSGAASAVGSAGIDDSAFTVTRLR